MCFGQAQIKTSNIMLLWLSSSGNQDKNTHWNIMSQCQQPGHVASTNRNTAKIMRIMTHYVSVVSGLHSVYQLNSLSLRLDIIIDMLPGTCLYLSDSCYLSASTEH